MTWRQRKKLFYGLIFIGLIAGILILIFLAFRATPSCRDRRQNQGETGVDCGGPCLDCAISKLQPLKTYPARHFIYEDNSFDLIGEIENPNGGYGVVELEYQFIIRGSGGEVAQVNGTSFILPTERKYILNLNRQAPVFPIASVNFSIIKFPVTSWRKIPVGEDSKVRLELLNSEFQADASGRISGLKAEIINSGSRDYFDLTAKFVILDSADEIIGAVSSQIDQLEALQRQTLQLALPPLSGTPAKVIFQADSNIFK